MEKKRGCSLLERFLQTKQTMGNKIIKLQLKHPTYTDHYLYSGMLISEELLTNVKIYCLLLPECKIMICSHKGKERKTSTQVGRRQELNLREHSSAAMLNLSINPGCAHVPLQSDSILQDLNTDLFLFSFGVCNSNRTQSLRLDHLLILFLLFYFRLTETRT